MRIGKLFALKLGRRRVCPHCGSEIFKRLEGDVRHYRCQKEKCLKYFRGKVLGPLKLSWSLWD